VAAAAPTAPGPAPAVVTGVTVPAEVSTVVLPRPQPAPVAGSGAPVPVASRVPSRRGRSLLIGGVAVTVAALTAVAVVLVADLVAPVPAAAAPVAAAAPSRTPAPGTYTDTEDRFALVPPSGWVADTSGTTSPGLVFNRPVSQGAVPGRYDANVYVAAYVPGGDLDAEVAIDAGQIHAVKGYVPIGEAPYTLADGTPAHSFEYSMSDDAGTGTLHVVEILAVRDGLLINVAGTSLEEEWATVGPSLTAAVRSVTLDPA
jgi:hypothetical protein